MAEIMQFTGRRVRQPAQNAPAAAKVPPARIAPVNRITPEDETKMRAWAEERLRDAIRIYRSLHTSEMLATRLVAAAEDELALIRSA
jgi:hypothetical protein